MKMLGANIGRLLHKAHNSVHWWIGDWLNYGMKNFESTDDKARDVVNPPDQQQY
jgi:hypothetical protein